MPSGPWPLITLRYEEDIYAWSQEQARLLRGLASSGAPLPNALDLEHVAEEIEDLGNEQRFQVESNLEQALIHLTKLVALPASPAARHWMKEIGLFLHNARRRYRPSMRRAIDPEKVWGDARRRALEEFDIDEQPAPPLPETCPFALEELPAGITARELAARMASTIDWQR